MFYKYLFYSTYRIAIFLGNEGFFPEGVAYFATAMLPWLNFLTILNLIEMKLGKVIFNTSSIVLFYVAYLTVMYIYYFRKDHYKKILNEAANSSSKLLWGIVVFTYAILSLTIYFIVADSRRSMAISG